VLIFILKSPRITFQKSRVHQLIRLSMPMGIREGKIIAVKKLIKNRINYKI
jgi:hypothetical protein